MSHAHADRTQQVIAAMRAATYADRESPAAAGPRPPERFVTISREAGAGGRTLGAQLVAALNARPRPPGAAPWADWDHELVEKVSAEHHIPEPLIDAMEDASHPWFADVVAMLTARPDEDELRVYRRVAMTVRALAKAGRAVIVGRGGAFVTAGMPGGVHVRLVAPFDARVRRMADRLRVSPEQAAARVREIDHNRAAFYRRYWPGRSLGPESFTLTLNTAELTDAQMVACLVPLLLTDAERGAAAAAAGTPGATAAADPPRRGCMGGGACCSTRKQAQAAEVRVARAAGCA